MLDGMNERDPISRMNDTPEGSTVCMNHDDCQSVLKELEELKERIAIMTEPVKRIFHPRNRLFECTGCGECVSGIAKYCEFCGRQFAEDEED